MQERIKALAQSWLNEGIAIRRHLHQHPELSFQEKETSQFIAGKLEAYGIPFQGGWAGGTGIVALIEGRQPSDRVVALRADMDALPIQEANQVSYCSVNEGVMHACGHDVHTTCLLGAAYILQTLRESWSGKVKLLFQPGEELLPGGASLMIGEGALENPAPGGIFGQHVEPPLQAGKVGFRPGRYMASSDEIYLTIEGKGGHGAMPHQTVDPILIAAHLITGLQQVISRNTNPFLPAVLTFGHIASEGGATNIIPNTVKIKGTFRTLDESWRFEAHERIRKMARQLAESMGGHCECRIEVGYPVLDNDEALTMKARKQAEAYLGASNVVDLPQRLTSEDFAFYSQVLPACFYRLGVRRPDSDAVFPVHTNTFDVDESCLETGAGLMAWLAVADGV
ncbi:MAG: amidohydrolase [Saprospiraceae bacterium]|nr:amidohydrolase [Saprospiraceae bacterium]